MRIFSESWNDEKQVRGKNKTKQNTVWMEKVTLHSVTEASDGHFLTATWRGKKPWIAHTLPK